jgi:hypothetical protein
MKKLLILGLILVLLSACIVIEEAEEPEVVVKEEAPVQVEQPVEEVKEVEKVVVVKKKEPSAYIAENLEIPTKYWYYNTDTDFGATVYGDKRASSWDDVSNKYTLCYWSPKSQDIYILYSEISEFGLMAVQNISEDPTPGVQTDYLAYVRKEVSMKNYPESPVDWMVKFKNDIPVRIETNTEVLKVENRYITSDLKLHYKLNDEVYILKFDSHNKVPVLVERTRNGIVLERKKYYYDTQEYNLVTLRNADITADRVEMPSDIVILSDDEAKEYEKMEYWRNPDDYNPLIVIDQVVKVFEGKYVN